MSGLTRPPFTYYGGKMGRTERLWSNRELGAGMLAFPEAALDA